MGVEIERKFLVIGNDWRRGAVGVTYRQGYIVAEKNRTVRVRRAGQQGFLTIKGGGSGLRRQEFEYRIPVADADELLDTLCLGGLIEKIRYRIEWAGFIWEIDQFTGDNAGLLVAEIELEHENQSFALPPWVGEEVTNDPRYYNACLSLSPYSHWSG